MSRQRKIPTPAWDRDRGITGGLTSSRLQILAVAGIGLLVVAALGLIGWGFLSDYIEDQQRPGSTAIKVDDYEFTVSDYTERVKLYTAEVGTTNYQFIMPTVTQQLIEEAILLQYASEKGAEVTEDDMRLEIASLLGIVAADPSFDQLFQDELASSSLSEQEYRDRASANVLQEKMLEVFKGELPETAESVHYRQIVVADQATADGLKTQIEDGADFATLATENSSDTATKDKGGDAGWTPKGVLAESLDNLLFSLDQNQVVTFPGQSTVTIYQLIESDDEHPVDDGQKATLSAVAYQDWLDEKLDAVDLENEMDFQTGNGDKISYVIEHAGLTAQ